MVQTKYTDEQLLEVLELLDVKPKWKNWQIANKTGVHPVAISTMNNGVYYRRIYSIYLERKRSNLLGSSH